MENFKNTKDRLLSMHSRLMEGKMLFKAEEAKRFGVPYVPFNGTSMTCGLFSLIKVNTVA